MMFAEYQPAPKSEGRSELTVAQLILAAEDLGISASNLLPHSGLGCVDEVAGRNPKRSGNYQHLA